MTKGGKILNIKYYANDILQTIAYKLTKNLTNKRIFKRGEREETTKKRINF